MPAIDVVPGDLVDLGMECRVVADMVLIRGECTMEEGMLTGESVSLHKSALSDNKSIFHL